MRAVWWWLDRWRKSTAFLSMNAEQQGLYRNLLDSCWLFPGGVIPGDDRTLLMASGGDVEAWARNGPFVLRWMTPAEGGWTNETAQEVIHQAQRRATNQRNYRQRHDNKAGNGSDNGPDNEPGNKGPADNEPDNAAANEAVSPSPSNGSTLDSRRRIDRGDHGGRPPSINPFIPLGGRPRLEQECEGLVRRLSELTGEDPVEVIARASGYEGARRTKLNPASMSDDRLLNTLRDLRADVAEEERNRAKKSG